MRSSVTSSVASSARSTRKKGPSKKGLSFIHGFKGNQSFCLKPEFCFYSKYNFKGILSEGLGSKWQLSGKLRTRRSVLIREKNKTCLKKKPDPRDLSVLSNNNEFNNSKCLQL